MKSLLRYEPPGVVFYHSFFVFFYLSWAALLFSVICLSPRAILISALSLYLFHAIHFSVLEHHIYSYGFDLFKLINNPADKCIREDYISAEGKKQTLAWCTLISARDNEDFIDVLYDPSGEILKKREERSDEWTSALFGLAKIAPGSALNAAMSDEDYRGIEFYTIYLGDGYYDVYYHLH